MHEPELMTWMKEVRLARDVILCHCCRLKRSYAGSTRDAGEEIKSGDRTGGHSPGVSSGLPLELSQHLLYLRVRQGRSGHCRTS